MVFRSSTLLKIFFALLLVFAQQQAVMHLLGHDFERLTHKQDTGHSESVCATCLAVAQLDHADGVAPIHCEPVIFAPPRFDASRHVDAPLAFVGRYLSRGPPLFS